MRFLLVGGVVKAICEDRYLTKNDLFGYIGRLTTTETEKMFLGPQKKQQKTRGLQSRLFRENHLLY